MAQRHAALVRVALGAQRRDILSLVVGQSLRLALAGVVLGTLAAMAQRRWLQPLLFEQSARDPVVATPYPSSAPWRWQVGAGTVRHFRSQQTER